jgi:hypothetical protein
VAGFFTGFLRFLCSPNRCRFLHLRLRRDRGDKGDKEEKADVFVILLICGLNTCTCKLLLLPPPPQLPQPPLLPQSLSNFSEVFMLRDTKIKT